MKTGTKVQLKITASGHGSWFQNCESGSLWLDGPDHKCGTTETAAPLGISHSNKEGKKTDFLPLWNEMAQPDSTRREGPQSDPRA